MLGGGCRIGLSVLLNPTAGMPWGTLTANLTGTLLLGYLLTRLLLAGRGTTTAIPLFCTGILGSYTTFSTFSLEAVLLVERGQTGLAGVYVVASLVLGLTAATLGIRWAERSR